MGSVNTIAFGFVNPEAIRVFLQLAGYRVSIFDGSTESLDLRTDQPASNIVILPNIDKRNLLADHADQISRLVLLTNGKHRSIVDLGIPIVDSEIEADSIRQARDRTPHYYVKQIKEAAVPLDLQAVVAHDPEQEKPADPKTIDQWFDVLDRVLPEEINFDRNVEYPVCQYLIGQLSQKDLRGALKILVENGADNNTVRLFYSWLLKLADSMSAAMRAYLMPTTEKDVMTIPETAKKYRVDPTDISLLESIYLEMQKVNSEGA